MDKTENVNTSLMPMNTLSSNNDLLAKMNSSDKEDIEEDESANIITNRVITSKVTNAAQELKITQDTKLLSALIRFDANFSSDTANYNWVVYHTPKEVRKNIKQIYQKISTKEINTQMLIHPIIIQMRSDQDVVININIVTDFYNKCFAEPNIQNNPLLTNFFNIGGTSFLKMNAGNKPFEGWAEKRVDKHCCRKCFTIFCPCCEFCLFSRYNKRWIVLNEDHLFYLNDPSSKEGKCVYFFDKDMTIENDGKKGLNINNASMYLNLQFNSFFEREIWKQELERRKINYKLLVDNNKYNAYTNSKNYNICQYFCDGRDYFTDLFYQLMEAKQTIFITDWWMSPEVFLLRPVDEKIYLDMKEKGEITRNLGNKMTRLMDVLNYKAKQGVKIYILVYYEVSLALTLNSKHTEEILNGLNKNINVTRHPSDPFSTLLWSHHEKLVVIDQTIGYVGGLDLCWGRYDYSQHPIYEGPNPQREYHFPLIDYSNARICDFKDVQNYTIESVKREDTTRMPWHDVHSKIIGPAVCDIARHFIERWNHANFAERKEKGITSINQGAAFSQNKFNFWALFSKALKKNSKEIETKKNENKIENPLDKLESTQTIEIKEENKIGFQEKKTLENNFMKNKDKIDDDHLLVKKGENSFYKTLVQRMGKLGSQAMKIDLEHQISNDDLYKKYFKEDSITANVQVLRSASEWSAGLRATEKSILNGYYELISNAKHYIYIENQFFVSKAWTDEERKQCKHSISDIVQNEIALYLRKRIEKAYLNKENFKVYIFVPLLPGFAGEPEESPTLQIIVKHTYAGICNNHGLSLIEQLQKIMGQAWQNYIGFYSLRNHCLVNGVPKTEIIYIHSKLMIVDDTKVLIGSANINDRSMLGKRDSEFAVIIKERKQKINKRTQKNFVMNGNSNYRAANFATLFRKDLMAEHLGLNRDDPILDDPVSNQLFSLIVSRANSNTQIYRDIFGCYPDDTYTNFNRLKDAKLMKEKEKPEELLNKYNLMKDKIVGHIVTYPLKFLIEETLGNSFFSVENLVPEHNFT